MKQEGLEMTFAEYKAQQDAANEGLMTSITNLASTVTAEMEQVTAKIVELTDAINNGSIPESDAAALIAKTEEITTHVRNVTDAVDEILPDEDGEQVLEENIFL